MCFVLIGQLFLEKDVCIVLQPHWIPPCFPASCRFILFTQATCHKDVVTFLLKLFFKLNNKIKIGFTIILKLNRSMMFSFDTHLSPTECKEGLKQFP